MSTAMARHVLLKSKNEAEKIKQLLADGEDFAKLAKKYSRCNSAKKGGDLGEVRCGPGKWSNQLTTLFLKNQRIKSTDQL